MSLAGEYRQQFGWRPWPAIFEALPTFRGQTVLDLGCGPGDLASELVARGARVIGVDVDDELLREARSKGLEDAEFRRADLKVPLDVGTRVDGVRSSFTAAYFPNLMTVLPSWATSLRSGGWIALTEIDDLFGREPLSSRARSLLGNYAREALYANRYDFTMGRKLQGYLERSQFRVVRTLTLEDKELSFQGPARPDVLIAWRDRIDRMKLLRTFCGPEFNTVREEFVACLGRAEHRSVARVVCCLARFG